MQDEFKMSQRLAEQLKAMEAAAAADRPADGQAEPDGTRLPPELAARITNRVVVDGQYRWIEELHGGVLLLCGSDLATGYLRATGDAHVYGLPNEIPLVEIAFARQGSAGAVKRLLIEGLAGPEHAAAMRRIRWQTAKPAQTPMADVVVREHAIVEQILDGRIEETVLRAVVPVRGETLAGRNGMFV